MFETELNGVGDNPIFIPEAQYPGRLRFLIDANPMAYVVRAYRERLAPGRLMLTRGCRMPYPSVTRPTAASKYGLFRGCAMMP